MRWMALGALLLCSFCGGLHATEISFKGKSFSVPGIPKGESSSVYLIRKDEKGQFLFATQEGLVLQKGTSNPEVKILSEEIFCAADPSGLLWGSISGNIYVLIEEELKLVGQEILRNKVLGLFVDRPQALWIIGQDEALRISNEEQLSFKLPPIVKSVIRLGPNHFMVSGTSGSYELIFSPHTLRLSLRQLPLPLLDALSHDPISGQVAATDPSGQLWQIDPSTWSCQISPLPFSTSPVHHHFLSKSRLLVGAGDGRVWIKSPEERWTECPDMGSKPLLSVFEDSDLQVWLGTDGNGYRLQYPHFISTQSFAPGEKTKINCLSSIASTLLIGTNEGLHLLEPSQVEAAPKILPGREVLAIAKTAKGSHLLGVSDNKAYWLQGGQISDSISLPFPKREKLEKIVLLKDSTVYFKGRKRVSFLSLHDQTWHLIGEGFDDKMNRGASLDLLHELGVYLTIPEDQILIVGWSPWDSLTWPFPDAPICLFAPHDDKLWALQKTGQLLEWKHQRWEVIPKNKGLWGNETNAIFDWQGHSMVLQNRQLFRYDPQSDFFFPFPGELPVKPEVFHPLNDSMLLAGHFQQLFFIRSPFSMYKKGRFLENQLFNQGKPLENGARISNRNNDLGFSWTYYDPAASKVYFQFRLLGGKDSLWSNPSSNTQVSFGSLPLGDYSFEVRALSPVGFIRPHLSAFEFSIRLPWYQTPLFFLMCAGLLVVTWVGTQQIKNRSLIRRKKQLEAEVDLATKELRFKNKEIHRINTQLEKLLNGETRYKEALLDSIPDLMLTISFDGILRQHIVNDMPGRFDFLHDWYSQPFAEAISVDYQNRFLSSFEWAIEQNRMASFQFRFSVSIPEQDFEARIRPIAGKKELLILIRDITAVIALQRVREEQQKRISSAVIEAQEVEREIIAYEIHDDLGAKLAVLKMNLHLMEKALEMSNGPAHSYMETMRAQVETAIETARSVSHRLSPVDIEEYGLEETLSDFLDLIQESSAIQIWRRFSGDFEEIPISHQKAIYRVIQEATKNAVKHSKCATLSLQVAASENEVQGMIEDNGRGFSIEEMKNTKRRGLGLVSMENRIKVLGGILEIDSSPNRGTAISFFIPLLP